MPFVLDVGGCASADWVKTYQEICYANIMYPAYARILEGPIMRRARTFVVSGAEVDVVDDRRARTHDSTAISWVSTCNACQDRFVS